MPEWSRQDAILLAWPAEHTDWSGRLHHAQQTYRNIIDTIGRYQAMVVLVPDDATATELQGSCNPVYPLHALVCDYDDTWVRDSGPISAVTPMGEPGWLDFRFNGWGGKFSADNDDRIVAQLIKTPLFGHVHCEYRDWILEGGAIEVNGEGSVLTTASVFRQRFPDASLDACRTRLMTELGCDQLLMLDHGDLEGDDTDGHVDTIARFCDPGTIAFQGCRDSGDSHFDSLEAMRVQLQSFRNRDGRAFRLLELPWPAAKTADGQRLPAGYANFLILNDAVLVPTYDDPADADALTILQTAFPSRDVVGVPCLELIRQGGSLHCATMQLASGALPDVHARM